MPATRIDQTSVVRNSVEAAGLEQTVMQTCSAVREWVVSATTTTTTTTTTAANDLSIILAAETINISN